MKKLLFFTIGWMVTILVITRTPVSAQTGNITSVNASEATVISPPNTWLGDLDVTVVATATTTTAAATFELKFELEQKSSLGNKVIWIPLQPLQGGAPVTVALGLNTTHQWNPQLWPNVDYGGLASGDYRVIAVISEVGPPGQMLDNKIYFFNKP